MSILFIEGPEGVAMPRRSEATFAACARRVAACGRALQVVRCGTEAALAQSLRQDVADGAEVVLLDPNACVPPGADLEAALRSLQVPLIEVHDDGCGVPEAQLGGGARSRLALVHGFGAQSDTLALAIALERLGAREAGDVGVGT